MPSSDGFAIPITSGKTPRDTPAVGCRKGRRRPALPKGAPVLRRQAGTVSPSHSIESEVRDVTRIGRQLAEFHTLDDVGEGCIGRAGAPHLLALAHHEAIEVLDLRAPTLQHILAHGGALLARYLSPVFEPLGVGRLDCSRIAFSSSGDGLG